MASPKSKAPDTTEPLAAPQAASTPVAQEPKRFRVKLDGGTLLCDGNGYNPGDDVPAYVGAMGLDCVEAY